MVLARFIAIVFLICSCTVHSGAQTHHTAVTIDSIRNFYNSSRYVEAAQLLENVLETQELSKYKGDLYLLQAQIEEAQGYAIKAVTSYKKSIQNADHNHAIIAKAYSGIASCYATLSIYDSIMPNITASLGYDSSEQIIITNNLTASRFWQSKNEHEKAVKLLQRSFKIAQDIGDKNQMALTLSAMGNVYFSESTQRAIDYYQQAKNLIDSTKQPNLLARTLGRIANALMVFGQKKEAEAYLRRAKNITDKSKNLPVQSYILASYAILEAENGNMQEAVQYSIEGLVIKETLGLSQQSQNDLLNISEFYQELKNYEKAREYVDKGINISKKLKDITFLKYFYERIATLDSIDGDYRKAYSHQKLASLYKDSIYSAKRTKALDELREKFESEQKERKIAEQELSIERHQLRNILIVSMSTLLIIALVFSIILIRQKHKTKLLEEKERQDKIRLQTIVNTQEEVQQNIARDIHDGLVQVLGAVKMSLSAVVEEKDLNTLNQKISSASTLIDDACSEARNISHQLLPYSLTKGGLVPALEDLFAKSFDHCEFSASINIKIPTETSIHIYRITQEVTNNIIKHANATFVKATLSNQDNFLNLAIEDNGIGFKRQEDKIGVGLTNIYTRVALLNGVVNIQSQPGAGTSVILQVPV